MTETPPDSYDLAVIGGGSGGYAAARTAIEHGLKTVVIDGAKQLGGLCILRGCMPSKTLIESANRFVTMRRAREFGLNAQGISVDSAAIIDRKRKLIGEFADYRAGQLLEGKFDLIRGEAQFVDPHTLQVTPSDGPAQTVTARTMVIATGSEIFVPPVDGLAETAYLTSDDVLDLKDLPDSIVVLGGGAIALEMAHYLEGLGKKLSVIQRSAQILTGMDRDVADAVRHALEQRMKIYCGTQLLSASRHPDGMKAITFAHEGSEVTVVANEILAALGRKPRTRGLRLENAGILTDGPRVLTDDNMATSQPHIFAAGDVCGPFEIVHVAITQGEIAARNAARLLEGEAATEEPETMDYRLKLYGIFTEPQVAVAGLSELEAAQQGRDIISATYPFNDHGKSIVRGETEGFVKLIADPKTKELLGGAAVGPEATELIHEIVVALHFRAKAREFALIPHYHPTLSEIWTYPAEELAEK